LVPYEEAFPMGFEDMRRRVPDISKVRSLIGWEPRHTLDDIIQEVVDHARLGGDLMEGLRGDPVVESTAEEPR